MNYISESAIIHPNVLLGDNVVIEDYCIIGSPVKGKEGLVTTIGANAVIRSGTVIYAGNKIGDNFQTGNKANIRENNEIGDNVSIGTLSVIEHHINIGSGTRIHSQVFIPEFSILGLNTWIGPNVVFTNAKYPQSPDVKNNLVGPTLEENVKIGANSTLLPGIKIGRNSLVGAASLVTKDVEDNVVVAGHPALVIRQIDY
ncbi:acyltransferase [Paraglaciecola chathamensis]|uniref:2,3,4,5-tetrahydropyridine-2,6-dicarboxylate N-acetyltransferase n=1 Tax=Paraglaciecola chathamensis S18K6 TaxID=1127672 RepID=A0AAV3V1M4_9ALTE|nr:acyltransferase [Paraglaciecola chathamensis]GAC10545.1 2,3,4,5-tetrahydropyridine-2,6-dicarboxylate N-acetyltransferase [Paraglaciecola chathamensis S18K6]